MNGDTTYSIGELARRTGLTVKTVRFYSDRGIVSPTGRNPAGHRRYGADAVARLELVRGLRELGLGLPAIRRVVERELSPAEVAAAQAEAIDLQIRVLRLRRAVLGAVARLGSTPEELTLVHRLARLTEDERARLIGEFLAGVFGGLADGSRFAAVARSLTPELPEEPSAQQVEAWVELARLAGDVGFRELLRGLVEAEAAEAERLGMGGLPRPGLAVAVRELAGPAVAAGVAPGSVEAAAVVAALMERCAEAGGVEAVRTRLVAMADPRRERYLELLAVVNGWSAPESRAVEVDWALRAVA
ncbi:MerR family transcriptional regulator [Kitasatospora brasiliensis]|uniref:MerR family transcriptional regulator n=1 Tax=Kitasatospora brasiliensis TaxID=3058040 RepID=UPI0029303F13|nr:MerR family transcriptional regulator [Kitasatospora sp. K002]